MIQLIQERVFIFAFPGNECTGGSKELFSVGEGLGYTIYRWKWSEFLQKRIENISTKNPTKFPTNIYSCIYFPPTFVIKCHSGQSCPSEFRAVSRIPGRTICSGSLKTSKSTPPLILLLTIHSEDKDIRCSVEQWVEGEIKRTCSKVEIDLTFINLHLWRVGSAEFQHLSPRKKGKDDENELAASFFFFLQLAM